MLHWNLEIICAAADLNLVLWVMMKNVYTLCIFEEHVCDKKQWLFKEKAVLVLKGSTCLYSDE